MENSEYQFKQEIQRLKDELRAAQKERDLTTEKLRRSIYIDPKYLMSILSLAPQYALSEEGAIKAANKIAESFIPDVGINTEIMKDYCLDFVERVSPIFYRNITIPNICYKCLGKSYVRVDSKALSISVVLREFEQDDQTHLEIGEETFMIEYNKVFSIINKIN